MAVASIAGNVAANRAADRQEQAVHAQNAIRQEEIAKAAGAELSERARVARRERAAARAAASQAGVNLDSNSFLTMLSTSEVNQTNDMGMIVYNERAQQRARHANYTSQLAQITKKTGLGIVLDAGTSFLGGYTAAGGNTSSLFGKGGKPKGGKS